MKKSMFSELSSEILGVVYPYYKNIKLTFLKEKINESRFQTKVPVEFVFLDFLSSSI